MNTTQLHLPRAVSARLAGSRRRFSARGIVGIVMLGVVLLVAVLGPLIAPDDPLHIYGAPFSAPSASHLLGLDYLGRDAFSRFVDGGRSTLFLALAATAVGYLLGLVIGLIASYYGGILEWILMRATDLLLIFPGLIFVLLLVAVYGSNTLLMIIGVGLANAPRIARVVYTAALTIVEQPYIEYARSSGEKIPHVARKELLPNILSPVAVDFGIRLSGSILLIAGLSFLGFGVQPPAPDWGLIISENLTGFPIQPYCMLAPIAAIALLTVGINLVIDGWRGASRATKDRSLASAR
jgi:peptide/nickel transport system permease protein